jgi:diguanylate cyclase (GGDEF)-like protein
VDRQQTLTNLVTGATAAIVALTACALYAATHRVWGTIPTHHSLWLMIAASTSATLLVMSRLHQDLQRLYLLSAAREEQAQREARTDLLTGLANRKSLIEELKSRLGNDKGAESALFLVDLNHFKRVNDTRGHDFGDELLIGIARRLEDAVPDAFIARLGGDEFAVICEIDGQKGAEAICKSVAGSFTQPFNLPRGACYASCSIGAAFLGPGLTVSENLRRADAAMYRAKADQIPFKVFDREMIGDVERRARLTEDLRNSAPAFAGLSIVYLPICGTDLSIIGLEALLRWKHPQFGHIPPPETISIAEEVQLINDIGLYVAREASRAALSFPNLLIALNISVVQLLDCSFADEILRVVGQNKVRLDQLQIEVREKDFAKRGQDMSPALALLSTAGIRIAVDDFGSSALSPMELRRYGVSTLKLDPRVLKNAREAANVAVMRANVDLARTLGMTVVCEGVATEGDLQAALEAGCDMVQGYLTGVPQELGVLRKELLARKVA